MIRFEHAIETHIRQLHDDIVSRRYRHGGYLHFKVRDKKKRDIAKSSVRDRIVHQLVYDYLYARVDPYALAHSYASRIGKGCRAARAAVRSFLNTESRNYTRTVWVMKCDVRRFFASVHHGILLRILERYQPAPPMAWLLAEIIGSYSGADTDRGLPLGNLTSQVLANIYLTELDDFVKYQLGVAHYARYNDDMLFVARDRDYLARVSRACTAQCADHLALDLKTVYIRKLSWGADVLGATLFPRATIMRRSTFGTMRRSIRSAASAYAHDHDWQRFAAALHSYRDLASQFARCPLPTTEIED